MCLEVACWEMANFEMASLELHNIGNIEFRNNIHAYEGYDVLVAMLFHTL